MEGNNKAIYSDELLSDEQLEMVQGGIAPAAGITIFINRGLSEADSIKKLVNSTEYNNMSNDDKNHVLGKERHLLWL